MNKGQFLLKLKKFNENIPVGRPKNSIMISRAAKDRHMFYSSTLTLVSIVNDKYFEDAIIEVETFFKELKDEPTKKITMLE